jgi:hypothetical protein
MLETTVFCLTASECFLLIALATAESLYSASGFAVQARVAQGKPNFLMHK